MRVSEWDCGVCEMKVSHREKYRGIERETMKNCLIRK